MTGGIRTLLKEDSSQLCGGILSAPEKKQHIQQSLNSKTE
jgi:hypothetical protein